MSAPGVCKPWQLSLPAHVKADLCSAIEVFRDCDESGALWNKAEVAAVRRLLSWAEILYATAGRPSSQVISDGTNLFFLKPRPDGRPLVFLSEDDGSKPIAWPGCV